MGLDQVIDSFPQQAGNRQSGIVEMAELRKLGEAGIADAVEALELLGELVGDQAWASATKAARRLRVGLSKVMEYSLGICWLLSAGGGHCLDPFG
ncbi:hypothetical protein [Desulfobulbus alkaliphilus]|uniref:hypothetical protein n=1 Tax=Desulfobulbus alkaliphilus TaxID=869814 RepID=UPI001962FB46|nr:hypothetical protein [Desulfobulbus alkaliphilus]MBM9538648.1 hypothetical protein [Desulfobulbus alkaliphilus]